jgi:hypothetical protein
MKRPIEPAPSQGRIRYPDADPEALAWVAEKARGLIDDGWNGAVGWEWLPRDEDCEPDPENDGPAARVFNANGGTVVAVTEGG